MSGTYHNDLNRSDPRPQPWLRGDYECALPLGVWRVHEAADIFPMLSEEELGELAEDISAHGLHQPVVFCLNEGREGRELVLVDGRNRAAAVALAGESHLASGQWRLAWFDSEEQILDYIRGQNIHRRHLNASQRAMYAAHLVEMYSEAARQRQAHGMTAPGRTLMAGLPEAFSGSAGRTAREEVAELAGVSGRLMGGAQRIRRTCIPEIPRAVMAKDVSVTAAEGLAKLHPREQEALMAQEDVDLTSYATSARKAKPPETLWVGRLVELNTGTARRGQRVIGWQEQVWIVARVKELAADGYVVLDTDGGTNQVALYLGRDSDRIRLLGGGVPLAPPAPEESKQSALPSDSGSLPVEQGALPREGVTIEEGYDEEEGCCQEDEQAGEAPFDPATFTPEPKSWVAFIEDLDDIPAGSVGQIKMTMGLGGVVLPPPGAEWEAIYVSAPILRPATKEEIQFAKGEEEGCEAEAHEESTSAEEGADAYFPPTDWTGDAPEAEQDIEALDEMLQDAEADAGERDVVYTELLQLSVRVSEAIGAIERKRPAARGWIRFLRRMEIEIRTRAEEVRAGAAAR